MKRRCGIDKCEIRHYAMGLCQAHYNRKRASGSVGTASIGKPIFPRLKGLCKLRGCSRPNFARKVCQVHYQLMRSVLTASSNQRACDIEGCGMLHQAKGLCHSHYHSFYAQKIVQKLEQQGIDTDFGTEEGTA